MRERTPRLAGHLVGDSYVSAGGFFTVSFPVSPEVGGRIIYDDSLSVTFRDNWGSRISFSSRPISPESPMMKVLQTQGRAKALDTLVKDIYGNLIVPSYHPEILDGTVSFIYLRPVGPKTGVAAFIHGTRIYMVDTDLIPGVQLLSGSDDASQQARDEWLENRAVELLRTMQVK